MRPFLSLEDSQDDIHGVRHPRQLIIVRIPEGFGNDIGAGIGELSDAISTGVGERQELHASIRPGGGPGHEPLLLETADGSAEIALVHAQQAGYVSCAHGLSLADLDEDGDFERRRARSQIAAVEQPHDGHVAAVEHSYQVYGLAPRSHVPPNGCLSQPI